VAIDAIDASGSVHGDVDPLNHDVRKRTKGRESKRERLEAMLEDSERRREGRSGEGRETIKRATSTKSSCGRNARGCRGDGWRTRAQPDVLLEDRLTKLVWPAEAQPVKTANELSLSLGMQEQE